MGASDASDAIDAIDDPFCQIWTRRDEPFCLAATALLFVVIKWEVTSPDGSEMIECGAENWAGAWFRGVEMAANSSHTP